MSWQEKYENLRTKATTQVNKLKALVKKERSKSQKLQQRIDGLETSSQQEDFGWNLENEAKDAEYEREIAELKECLLRFEAQNEALKKEVETAVKCDDLFLNEEDERVLKLQRQLDEQTKAYQQEIAQMKEEFGSSKDVINDLNAKCEDLKENLRAKDEMVYELKIECDRLEHLEANASQEVDKLKDIMKERDMRALDDLKAISDSKNKYIHCLENEIQSWKEEVELLKQNKATIESNQVEMLQNEIKGLSERLEDAETVIWKQSEKLEQTEEAMQQSQTECEICTQSSDDIIPKNDEIQELREIIEKLTKEKTAMHGKLETLRKQRDMAEKSIEDLEIKMFQSQDLETIKEEIREKVKQQVLESSPKFSEKSIIEINNLKETVAQLRREKDAIAEEFQNQINEFMNDLDCLKNVTMKECPTTTSVANHDAKFSHLREIALVLKKKKEEAEHQLRNLKSHRTQSTKEFMDKCVGCNNLDEQAAEEQKILLQKIETLQGSNHQISCQFVKLQEIAGKDQVQWSHIFGLAKNEIDDLKTEVADLESELEHGNEKFDELNHQFMELQDHNAQLQKEMEDVKEQCTRKSFVSESDEFVKVSGGSAEHHIPNVPEKANSWVNITSFLQLKKLTKTLVKSVEDLRDSQSSQSDIQEWQSVQTKTIQTNITEMNTRLSAVERKVDKAINGSNEDWGFELAESSDEEEKLGVTHEGMQQEEISANHQLPFQNDANPEKQSVNSMTSMFNIF